MSWGTHRALAVAAVVAIGSMAGCTPRQPWRSDLASVNIAGDDGGNHHSRNPTVSADGTKVVFQSQASDLVPNDSNSATDVFVRTSAPARRHWSPSTPQALRAGTARR